ncbi:iron-sulfur cluster biosynthesis family protein [Ekhidna sp.]|jgi:iron-sulfur cluster assembly protein|uniref:HesB/IscA family protein n=1 Tax=Ekhidna sp. TaxID=2608089 RepID=UPI0032F01A3E
MKPPVEITDRALEEVKNILKNKGIPEGYGLRIATKGMGCGVGFKLGFDKKKDTDDEYNVDGVQVLIRKSEMMFLVGKKIEFYDESDGRGFVFT